MPSLSEGLPVVGVQALAMGLAMVVSNIGGFVDLVIEEKNGFLIDKTEDYQRRLLDLLANPQTLLSSRRESRLHAQNFSLEKIVREYEIHIS